MTSASPDDERDVPAAPRRVAGAVVFSLVLHGVVLTAFAHAMLRDGRAAAPIMQPPGISVALITRAPRPALPEPVPANQPEVPRAETPVVEVPVPEVASAAGEPDSAPAIAPDAIASQDDDTAEGGLPGERADNETAGSWNPARIRAAIDAGRRERQSEGTASWLSDCYVEQKQRGTRDCTRQQQTPAYDSAGTRAGRSAAEGAFAAITRPQRHAQLTEGFLRENALLGSIGEKGGAAGAIAAQLYAINHEYLQYLNGNGQDLLYAGMQNFRADREHVRPALQLSGNVLFVCRKRPCIYEWSDFTIHPPERDDATSFRVIPVVPRAGSNEPAKSVTP